MKTLVIGGGMSGLCYAIAAARNGVDVTVCEQNARLGRKIAMSGNGKCNIGNINVSTKCYNDSGVVKRVLDKISVKRYVDFLRSCGVYVFADEQGRLYPLSESASGVVDCLRFCLAKVGGKVIVETKASNVRRRGDKFAVCLDGKTTLWDDVIVTCGSKSQAECDLSALIDAKYMTELCPSLTPVRVAKIDGMLNGIRNKAVVSLYADGALRGVEKGEILFKDYGLSGICVFNLSAQIARDTVAKRKADTYRFVVDLVPDLSQNELDEIVKKRFDKGETDKLFVGILKNKLAEYVAKYTKNGSAKQQSIFAKNVPFTFEKLLDYSMSQVTAGGVDENFLDELRLPNGVAVLGEALNVDGLCGGNNLFFAAACALSMFDGVQLDIACKE